jgi:hypothetical protein
LSKFLVLDGGILKRAGRFVCSILDRLTEFYWGGRLRSDGTFVEADFLKRDEIPRRQEWRE